jgi:VanZ family protein
VRSFLKYWLPVLIWLGFIFVGSTDLMSAEHTSRIIEPFLRWLRPDISPEAIAQMQFVIRKCAHVTEYAILAMLFWRALRRGTSLQMKAIPIRLGCASLRAGFRLRSGQVLFIVVWLVCAIFAAGDEFHQSFVPSRTASAHDVMIDICGALIGLTICWMFAAHANRKSEI